MRAIKPKWGLKWGLLENRGYLKHIFYGGYPQFGHWSACILFKNFMSIQRNSDLSVNFQPPHPSWQMCIMWYNLLTYLAENFGKSEVSQKSVCNFVGDSTSFVCFFYILLIQIGFDAVQKYPQIMIFAENF